MQQVRKWLITVEEAITKILIVAVVLLVFSVAMTRWSGFPVAWSVELAQLLFIWLIFLGANQALRKNRHIGVNILTEKLPQKAQLILSLLMDLLIVAFLVTMVYYGIQHSILHHLRTISNLFISYSFVTASVPVGCTLMFLTITFKWFDIWNNNHKNSH